MANQKISDDPVRSPLDGSEIIPVVVPGAPNTNERTDLDAIADYTLESVSSLTAASALTNGDEFLVIQGGNVRKPTTAGILDLIPNWPSVMVGAYRTQALTGTNPTSTGVAANRIDIAPIIFERDYVCDEFGVYCTSAATAGNHNHRVIIYESNATGLPTNIILQSADTNATAVGFYATTPPGGEYTFKAGQTYWVGMHTQSSNSGNFRTVQTTGLRTIGQDATSNSVTPTILRRSVTFTSGAPDPWGAMATHEYQSSTSFIVFLRRAS